MPPWFHSERKSVNTQSSISRDQAYTGFTPILLTRYKKILMPTHTPQNASRVLNPFHFSPTLSPQTDTRFNQSLLHSSAHRKCPLWSSHPTQYQLEHQSTNCYAIPQFLSSPEIFSDFHSETCTLVKQCSIHRKFYSCPNRCLSDVHPVPKITFHFHHFNQSLKFRHSTCPINDSSFVLQNFLTDELKTTTTRRPSESPWIRFITILPRPILNQSLTLPSTPETELEEMEAIALHSPRSPDSSPSFDRNDINPEYLKHSTNQALSLRSSPVAVALYDVALIDHIMRHAIEYASRLKRLYHIFS